jgi:hypothetical protein
MTDTFEWMPTDQLSVGKAFEVAKLDQQVKDAIKEGGLDIDGCLALIHNLNCLYQGTRQVFGTLASESIGFELAKDVGEDNGFVDMAIVEQDTLDAIASWLDYAVEIAPPPPALISAIESILSMISPTNIKNGSNLEVS